MNSPSPHLSCRFVGFHAFGGPQVLEVMERDCPAPEPGEVVVRVAASPVNPTDTLMRAGRQAALMTQLAPPYVAGMEFAGHVHRLGDGVTGLAPGQAVMGVVNPRTPSGGAHAQFLRVPAASVVPLQAAADLALAATVPMNGLTAHMALEALGLAPGQALLVTGATGAVGGYTLTLARQAGLTVVADAKEADTALVRELGAHHVVPRGEALGAAVRRLFPQGVDGLVDGALLGDAVAALVKDGGAAVSLRRSNPIQDPRLTTHYVSVIEQMRNTPVLAKLAHLLASGVLRPRLAHKLPMAEAARAHELVEQGGLRGRVVLEF